MCAWPRAMLVCSIVPFGAGQWPVHWPPRILYLSYVNHGCFSGLTRDSHVTSQHLSTTELPPTLLVHALLDWRCLR